MRNSRSPALATSMLRTARNTSYLLLLCTARLHLQPYRTLLWPVAGQTTKTQWNMSPCHSFSKLLSVQSIRRGAVDLILPTLQIVFCFAMGCSHGFPSYGYMYLPFYSPIVAQTLWTHLQEIHPPHARMCCHFHGLMAVGFW